MLLWGLTSMSMAWVSSAHQFYVLRFMLGVFEAGFFPGIVLYLTYWYPPLRRASVLSFFFAGVAVAGILGGAVSGWIIRDMDGVAGLKGWQWMFFLEGSPALVLAVVAYFRIQDYPEDAAWLSRAEKSRIAANLGDGSGARHGHAGAGLRAALRDPRVYLFSLPYFSVTAAALMLNFWMPLMIREFGIKDVVMVSLYSIIPNAVGVVGVIVLARRADRTAGHVRYFSLCSVTAAVALAVLTTHPANLAVVLALMSLAFVMLFSALPIFWAIPTAHMSVQARAGGIGVISSLGTSAGIVTPWAIGQIKTQTGSMDPALLGLGVLLLLATGVMIGTTRNAPKENAQ
jgi:MFS family permease